MQHSNQATDNIFWSHEWGENFGPPSDSQINFQVQPPSDLHVDFQPQGYSNVGGTSDPASWSQVSFYNKICDCAIECMIFIIYSSISSLREALIWLQSQTPIYITINYPISLKVVMLQLVCYTLLKEDQRQHVF